MASRDHTSFYIGGKWLPAQSERRLRRRVTAFTGTHRIGSGRVVRRHRRGRDGGSTAVGRRIGEICGAQIKRAVLELGGKSASIICPDADLELAIATLVGCSVGTNQGQSCVAMSRILAPGGMRRSPTGSPG